MPVELGSFDVIVGMDWLKTYHAVIECDEKIVSVPFEDVTLIIRCNGSNNGNQLNIISCTKTRKYLLKGYPVFLANITTKTIKDKSKEKQLEDVPIVRDFSEVFLEDLPELLKKEELYAKFSKCEFWIPKVQFLCNTPKNACRSGILYGGVTS
nr:putative reverse transcriptase domain-containing protein [Tanacetum cinerariifolium]